MERTFADAHENGTYTYEDYCSWSGEERYELIDGWAYLMSAPNEAHHDSSWALAKKFDDFFADKPCKPYMAPFEVRLFPHNTRQKEQGLVQPDLFVVCDRSKSDGAKINGAPDLVVEILSPSTMNMDYFKKLKLYTQAEVREYWIVDPSAKTVLIYAIKNRRHTIAFYGQDELLCSALFPELKIPLAEIFPNE